MADYPLTDAQIKQLAYKVRGVIRAESKSVPEVPMIDTLEGIESFPVVQNVGGVSKYVRAPIYLLSQPAWDAVKKHIENLQNALGKVEPAIEAAESATAESEEVTKESRENLEICKGIIETANAYVDQIIETERTDRADGDASTLSAAKEYADEALGEKVDKITGKGLSTNDYTNEAKEVVDSLANFDPAAMTSAISKKANTADVYIKTEIDTAFGQISNDVGSKDTAVLEAAKEYTNTRETAILSSADTKDTTTLNSAKEYTDGRKTEVLSAVDIKDAATFRNAKEYTDGREASILTAVDIMDAATLRTAKEYADTIVSALVDNSPAALDTLVELAAALGNDPNFATTVMAAIGNKVDKVAGKGLSTNDYTDADRTKLAGVAVNANNYVHPNEANTRHVTDTEKSTWNDKETPSGAQEKANASLVSAKKYADEKIAEVVGVQTTRLDNILDGNYEQ